MKWLHLGNKTKIRILALKSLNSDSKEKLRFCMDL